MTLFMVSGDALEEKKDGQLIVLGQGADSRKEDPSLLYIFPNEGSLG